MRKPLSTFLAIALAGASVLAHAKRTAPNPVQPVVAKGVRYSANHDSMGFIFATDLQTGDMLWRRQIYVVKANPKIESDIQDCYITEIKLESGNLLIKNESNYIYRLNLDTLEVVPVHGKIVVQKAPK